MLENASSSSPDHVPPEQATTEISYCPHLNLYHYKRADGSEYFFDTSQLESSIASYVQQGDPRQAEFMATLTAWARRFPHKMVTFFADGRFTVRELEPYKEPDAPEEPEGSEDQSPEK